MSKVNPHASNLARACFGALPAAWRHSLYRKMIDLPAPPEDLIVRVAKSKEELEAAYRLLHDSYVAAGLMEPHPSGLRVTVYHALPSTSTLVALKGGRVVGTASVIRDSPLGFPLDRAFDTKALRRKGARPAEISALALHPSCRGQRGHILLPLMKFIYEYCDRFFGVNYMVIGVHPRSFDFYEAILGFEGIGQITNYSFVNGAPATAGVLDLARAPMRYAGMYAAKPSNKNVYRYFTEVAFPQLQYPDRSYFSVSDPVMTPELLHYFFSERTNLFAGLGERERAILHGLYDSDRYQSVLPKLPEGTRAIRIEKRFAVECQGRIYFEGSGRSVTLRVKDVSKHGLRAYLEDGALQFGASVRLEIRIAGFSIARLIASPVWTDNQGLYGFRLERSTESWTEFTQHLDRELLNGVA